MKIAYLILAHDNPAHLQRLTRALSSQNSAAFIHIDRKSDLKDFARVPGADTTFSQERVAVYWGDFSQVEATLALIRLALVDDRRFDYFVLLSGADYPLRTAAGIEQFFERNSGDEFISVDRTASDALLIDRLSVYRPRPTDSKLARAAYAVGMTFRLKRRRDYKSYLGDLIACGGSTWWALSRGACAHIQDYVANSSHVVDFFEHTRCPDESYFQTILANSPYKAKIKSSLTYADWSDRRSSPQFLTKTHVTRLMSASPASNGRYRAGEVLFARKFSDSSGELVAELDALMRERATERSG